jgi:hypothetical protein
MLVKPTRAVCAVGALHDGERANDRPGLGDPAELLVIPAPTGAEFGEAHRDKHFVRRERGFEVADEEIGGRDRALAVRALSQQFGVERERAGGQVTRRVAVGQGAAQRAAVADLGVAHLCGDVGKDAAVRPYERVPYHRGMRGGCADDDAVPVVADALQRLEASDVDERGRGCQAQFHQREQAVPAGEDLGVLTVLRQRGDCLLDGAGPDVHERGGDHCWPPVVSDLASRFAS